MLTIQSLQFSSLLFSARNYLGEISYSSNNLNTLEIPLALKPFIDLVIPTGSSLNTQNLVKPENLVELPQGTQKALFLDRDGVINVDHGYVGKIEQVDLLPGIAKFISQANHKSYDVNVITNQSGIGRGFYSNIDYQNVMKCIQGYLSEEQAHLDHIEFAPYHPEAQNEEYLQGRYLRKPRPGMILKLQLEHVYDLKNSILIGDKASDLMAGVVAGVGRLYLFESDKSIDEWQIFKNWLDELKKYGFTNEFSELKIHQLTDFSEVSL